jgi:hypothetical protein
LGKKSAEKGSIGCIVSEKENSSRYTSGELRSTFVLRVHRKAQALWMRVSLPSGHRRSKEDRSGWSGSETA